MYLLIILLLIFLIFGYPLLRIYLAYQSARRRFNNMFGGRQPRQASSQSRQGRKRRTKIITHDVGEYIEFEDIPGKPETTYESASYTESSQIEDVEWEDL